MARRKRYRKLRQEIIDTCLRMNAEGINQGTSGNVSARVSGGFLITPSGIPYDRLTTDMIVEMDLGGGYYGSFLPSSEWRMHLDVYRGRTEAEAVVHTHSIHATALACLKRSIPAFHYMVAAAGGKDIRVAKYATFGTQALSDQMLKALKDRKACLLANHGVIAFGPDLAKALWLAGEVETLARQYLLVLDAGEPILLGDAEMDRVLDRFANYGKQIGEIDDDALAALEPAIRRED